MTRATLVSGLTLWLAFCAAGAQDQPTMHAPDGGARMFIQSIDILPQQNAPFSAIVTAEVTRILVDGSTQSNWNRRTVARDSAGRIFQERRLLQPNGDKVMTPVTQLEYYDPLRHEFFACRPEAKICYQHPYSAPETMRLMPAGPLPDGRGSVKREELGRKLIEAVDVIGSREITTINAGVFGNEKSEPIVKEFWYSPRLGINIITKRFDPRNGTQNFVLSNINMNEPDPKIFEVPEGYRVVKMNGQ